MINDIAVVMAAIQAAIPLDGKIRTIYAEETRDRVKAFEDLNENFDHDPGEYAGAFGAPIRVSPSKPNTGKKAKKTLNNLDFHLVPATTFVDGLESMANLEIGRMPVFKIGALARLDDAVFDQANGSILASREMIDRYRMVLGSAQ
ncbi:hypothetical protein DSCO28_46910 [Desulfosarcina ovata subsp. sediminis]|uniref:Uncharacterized protein n=1 Tax=Desulfosarcina ovata subsp. sediminis TaxID=885957 RepID=A0A5K7ZV48_9BACT|nr:hypothetical protein [Desulfosarcina ovata]BBO84125.1 hypothetical protein DSCO28_46910 [Desulfosarcina ovata subsp. sediminis]